MDQQQQTQVEYGYLSRKLQLLEEIYSGYREEKKAWEENIEFFKNPLSLTTVTMKDCAFENLNDVTTLSSVYDHVVFLSALDVVWGTLVVATLNKGNKGRSV